MFQDPDIKTYGFRKIRTLNRVFQDPDVQGPDFSASGMCVRSAGAQLRHRSCRCAVAAPLPLRRRFWRADGWSQSRLPEYSGPGSRAAAVAPLRLARRWFLPE